MNRRERGAGRHGQNRSAETQPFPRYTLRAITQRRGVRVTYEICCLLITRTAKVVSMGGRRMGDGGEVQGG